jgi:hypothetical protein
MEFVKPVMSCNICCKVVTGRQQTLECDKCNGWVHRVCGTGISQEDYRAISKRLRQGGDFSWLCPQCSKSAATAARRSDETADDGDDDDEADYGPPHSESTRVDARSPSPPAPIQ